MYYGDPIIRKAVPLALGLLSASNPQLGILDTLSKYSHDNDLEVAMNAIFAMGLIGAGTNNARLAQMLRQLAGYYQKEADCLFVVRVAQGLVHMGKGTIGLNPFHTDRSLLSKPAIAGLLATLVAFIDAKQCTSSQVGRVPNTLADLAIPYLDGPSAVILEKSHWMIFFLVSAMYPRFFITLDEALEPIKVTARVGQVRHASFVLVFPVEADHLVERPLVGGRRRRAGGQAARHQRFRHPPDAGTDRGDRACRARHRRVLELCRRPRGPRRSQEERGPH